MLDKKVFKDTKEHFFMALTDILKRVDESAEYKQWRKEHADAFLAHAFVMVDEENKDVWQIGYFDEKEDKLTTFVVEPNKISVIHGQEVLKEADKIKPLEVPDIKISVEEALAKAEEARKEHYPREMILKKFFIIQHTTNGSIFNVTYFTQSFGNINIKISTIDGKILKHSFSKLADFMK